MEWYVCELVKNARGSGWKNDCVGPFMDAMAADKWYTADTKNPITPPDTGPAKSMLIPLWFWWPQWIVKEKLRNTMQSTFMETGFVERPYGSMSRTKTKMTQNNV
jgi:hypothetical protein